MQKAVTWGWVAAGRKAPPVGHLYQTKARLFSWSPFKKASLIHHLIRRQFLSAMCGWKAKDTHELQFLIWCFRDVEGWGKQLNTWCLSFSVRIIQFINAIHPSASQSNSCWAFSLQMARNMPNNKTGPCYSLWYKYAGKKQKASSFYWTINFWLFQCRFFKLCLSSATLSWF